MGKFKEYLQENEDLLQLIYSKLDELSDEELDEFGHVLFETFMDEIDSDDAQEDHDEDDGFDVEDVREMIEELSSDLYQEILDLLSEEDFQQDDEYIEGEPEDFQNAPDNIYEDSEEGESEELDEKVNRIMKVKNRNKKKKKFMGMSKSQLRRGKAQRKVQARKDKPKKKRYYRANKKKIQKYKQSYSKAIKSGKHIKKVRRR